LTVSHWKWIRIKTVFPLPGYVREAIQRLDEAGHVAYVVGGSVRDFLLGRTVKDHDIATSASPDEICALFPGSVTVGKAFGVIKVPVQVPGQPAENPLLLEIATFREDLEYLDHRHPTAVRFSGPIEDAQRRDFTINALFYDPKTARILDSTAGMDDLRAGVVRAIGEPRARFQEDALRLLRAARFTTTLGFRLDPETAKAAQAQARLIQHVSGERVRDELTLMLTGPRPAEAMECLAELGLLKQVLPEVEALRGVSQAPTFVRGSMTGHAKDSDIWSTTLRTLRFVSAPPASKRSVPLAWAALLYDVGKPVALKLNDERNFNGHEALGADIVRAVGGRLRMPRSDIDRIAALLEELLKFRDAFNMREATLERFVREPFFDELLELHRVVALSSDGNLAFYEYCAHRRQLALSAESREVPRLIDGKDLIQLGFKPGPEFSGILRTVEDLALEHQLTTKEEALEYVVSRYVR
jgi:tRNA nucleotidyltransferase/poly(A) polymerase